MRLILFLFCGSVVTSLACVSSCTDRSQDGRRRLEQQRGEERADTLCALSAKLAKGMTKDQVHQVLGCPDNRMTDPIWVWILGGRLAKSEELSWRTVYEDNETGFLYFVFRDDCLVAPRPINPVATSPWEVMRHEGGATREEAVRILGPEER